MEQLLISISRRIGGSRSLFSRMIRVIVIVRMIVTKVENLKRKKLFRKSKKSLRKKDLLKRKRYKLHLSKSKKLRSNPNHPATESKISYVK